jgi:hypothetical protein
MKLSNAIRILRSTKVFNGMMLTFGVSFVVYAFAIASTTIAVADSNVLNGNIQELRTEVAELEGTYYAMVSAMNQDHAQREGFTLEEDVVFAKLNQDTVVAYRD